MSNYKTGFMEPKKWLKPEEQGEEREGADVDSTSGDGREDATDEPGHGEGEGLVNAEVLNLVVGHSLVLSEVKNRSFV